MLSLREGEFYVLLAFSVFFDCLLKDEYRIRGASSWHKSKLAFKNFRALSQPSVNHRLPYFEGVCEQFDASVILTLLNVTLFFENGDQNAVPPGRWYALSGHDYVEKLAVSPLPIVPGISIPPLVSRRYPQPCHTPSLPVLYMSLPH